MNVTTPQRTRRHTAHPETVVIPVTGVGNFEIGPLSTAAIHLGYMLQRLKSIGNVAITRPIIPTGLGLFDKPDKLSRNLQKDIEKTLRPHPNTRHLYVAYSLGGILAARIIAEHDQTANLLSIASPHGGLSHQVPYLFNEQIDAINDFIRTTPGIMPTAEGGPRVMQLATNHDKLVSPGSALSRVPFAQPERHLIVDRLSRVPREVPEDTLVHRTLMPHDHLNIVATPESTAIISDMVRAMLVATSFERPELLPAPIY